MSKNEKKQYNCEFNVSGMHCAACELVIEKKFLEHKDVKKVNAALNNNKVYLQLAKGINPQDIKSELNALIEPDGYRLVSTPLNLNINWNDLRTAFVIALVVMGGFLLFQKTGIISGVGADQITYPFIFLVGVVASLSTCMAVVGGLCISISTTYAKTSKTRSLALFHLARIVGFFFLGGLIGLLGSAFTLSSTMSFILSLVLFFVMVIMGINLLDIIPSARKMQVKMPKAFGKQVFKLEGSQNVIAPILLGAATFFLPCGFTQSMQVYSLTTGSYLSGAMTMLIFALGTFPVLALISFASVKLSKTLQSGVFFKTAGLLVLFFAVFNFLSALAAIGVIKPIISF